LLASPSLQLSLQERLDLVNRSTLRTVILLACAALCAGLLASCGDADDAAGDSAAAKSTLEQTVEATSKLESAHLKAGFQLAPDGLLALGGPLSLRVSGPFASGAEDELPRFELAIAGALARQDVRARAISTGKQIFLRIDDTYYELGKHLLAHEDKASSKEHHGGLASLGLDPSAWVEDPQEQGTAVVGGVETIRIAGELDVEQLLDDVSKLLGGAGKGYDGLLTPKLRDEISGSVKSSHVDVWTGAQDKILRQLVAAIDFKFEDGKSPIPGLDGGRITLRLRLDDVNETTVAPTAPKDAAPLSDLTGEGGLGALLSGLGAGVLSGSGDDGEAFLKCLSSGSDTSDIVECASKLAPTP
jgi:hypothetical protein